MSEPYGQQGKCVNCDDKDAKQRSLFCSVECEDDWEQFIKRLKTKKEKVDSNG